MSQVVSVQYLRGIAASAVAIFHIGLIFGMRLHLGEAGVDMFFVISGFIMWLVTREREASASIFIKKRIMRIVPLYWCATFALAFCASIKPNLFPGVYPTSSHLVQSLLFIPQIAPDGSMFPLLVQGWTLNYEMFFYAMFALTLLLRGLGQIYCLSTIMLCLVIVGSLGESESPFVHTYTSPMLLEFLAGVWIGWLWTHYTLLNRRSAWTCLALGTIILIIGGIFPLGFSRVLCAGLPSATIMLGAISLERSGWVPNVASLKVLGDASYSIYLTHSLTQNAASILFAKYHIAINAYSYMFTVMTALIVGVVTYRVVETSLTGWLRRSMV